MPTRAVFAIWLMALSACLSAAADPLPEPPSAPQPDSPAIMLRPWGRVSRYAVWQNYGVDIQGRFRPRVLYTPDGAFYYSNGQPFPWLSARPLNFMPYASD